jgi:hypothetical protein
MIPNVALLKIRTFRLFLVAALVLRHETTAGSIVEIGLTVLWTEFAVDLNDCRSILDLFDKLSSIFDDYVTHALHASTKFAKELLTQYEKVMNRGSEYL